MNLQPITLAPKIFSELTFVWRKQANNPALRVFTENVLSKFLEGDS